MNVIIALTMVDQLCPSLIEAPSCLGTCPVVRTTIDRVSSLLGIPRFRIVPIVNTEVLWSRNEDSERYALELLYRALCIAEDRYFCTPPAAEGADDAAAAAASAPAHRR
jgi:hypothetical protein